jgi:phosphoglycolate phosphatase
MSVNQKAVLFDLDGTLWNSSREVLLCWNRVLAPLGRRITPPEMDKLMGLTPREIADTQFFDLPPAERYALTDRCLTAEDPYLYARGARLYPNVRETLRLLKKSCFIGLVSNCTEPYALAFLHAHGLTALFDDHETAGRTGLGKGENIRLLMARDRIEKAVYVGDTAKDLSAAQAAHIPFLYASWGFGNLDVQPCVDAFSALPASVSDLLED